MASLQVCLLPLDCTFLGGQRLSYSSLCPQHWAQCDTWRHLCLETLKALHNRAGPQRERGTSREGAQRPQAQQARHLHRIIKAGAGCRGRREWGRAARRAAQTCPYRAVAPPSGEAQHDFGRKKKKTLDSTELGRGWERPPPPPRPLWRELQELWLPPLLRAKKKGLAAFWSLPKASGCTKCEETTPSPTCPWLKRGNSFPGDSLHPRMG